MDKVARRILEDLIFVMLPNAILYYIPHEFINGLAEVPTDFLTGLVTFDGIMLAIIVLMLPLPPKANLSHRTLVIGLSLPFLLSALLAISGLLNLHKGTFGGPAAYLIGAPSNALGFVAFGIVMFFMTTVRVAPDWAV
jgi:hypothetical protein